MPVEPKVYTKIRGQVITIVHYFEVDQNNEGRIFYMGIVGDKQVIQDSLSKLSKDVRYCKSYHKRSKKEKGNRNLLWGIMVSCKFRFDKVYAFPGRNGYKAETEYSICESCEDMVGEVTVQGVLS
jgi:hypothetical protein